MRRWWGGWIGLAAAGAVACAAPPSETPPSSPDPHGALVAVPAEAPEPLLDRVRPLTLEGRRSGEGYFDATGRHLVFQSEREPGNPFFQIYVMDLERGDVARVSTGRGKTTCAWLHPDGRRVLFASTHEDPEAVAKQEAERAARESGEERRYAWDYDENYDLYVRDRVDGRLTRLTEARGYDAEGAFSPDGGSVVFASNRRAYASPLDPEAQARLERDPAFFMELYRLDLASGALTQLTDSPGYDGGPFFSADGERIVWRRFSPDGARAEVFSMKSDGSDVRQLTRMGVLSFAPFFHPSGDYVIFASNREGFGNFELYVVDAEGQREPVRVSDRDGFDGLPAFHPDGHQPAFTSGRGGGGSQIYLADWDDAAARSALGLPPAASAPTRAASPAATDFPGEGRLRAHVDELAGERAAGRLTGTDGERVATAYVADVFQGLGLAPAGDGNSFFQVFEFTAGLSLGERNELQAEGRLDHTFVLDDEWRPLAFSHTGELASSELAFAGYGIVAPAGGGLAAQDAYADLDVRDRVVMVLRYVPEGLAPEARQHLRRYASLRYKAMVARDRGARGILVVSGPNSKVRQPLVPLSFDASLAGSSIAALSLSDAAAERLLAA
ncbi:MAG: peptidase M28, partial [Proteobacteria bacterium]|nr:peptidase M28 [Pseudomonadota bacterium]